MKRKHLLIALLAVLVLLPARAQKDSVSHFSVGADFYSNYIWRGSKFGKGPAFQPSVKYNQGIFTIGVWGSFDALGYTEADPYFSFALPVGLSFGMTDYYYGSKLFNTSSDSSGSHAFEINLGYTLGGLSLSGNYILNKAGIPASSGGDMYFQLGYAFKTFNVFVGGGNGWHTHFTNNPDKFAVCNVGIGTSRTIKITDTFSIPVVGQVIVNPDKEALYMAVGFTL